MRHYINTALGSILFSLFITACILPFQAVEMNHVEFNTARLEKSNPIDASVSSYRIASLQARKANANTTDLFTRLDAANAALSIK